MGRSIEEIDMELEKARHELRLAEIRAKALADLELEDRKAQHAMELEAQRGSNNLQVENRKGMWGLGAAIAGCLLGVGLTVWANNRGISQRDISEGSNKKRLLKW